MNRQHRGANPMSGRHRAAAAGKRRAKRSALSRWSPPIAAGLAAVVLTGAVVVAGMRGTPGTDAALDSADQPSATTTTRSPTGQPSAPPPRVEVQGDAGNSVRSDVPVRVPEVGSGNFDIAKGTSKPTGSGETVTYSVGVEGGLPMPTAVIARIVDRILADPRGWTAVDGRSVQRVDSGATIQVRLATPQTVDSLCAPLDTGGRLSCRVGKSVVLNAWRWVHGADSYGDDLKAYRSYMVNHEFGHALGYAHEDCGSPGELAPVMVQQTKGLDGCLANPWPAVTHP